MFFYKVLPIWEGTTNILSLDILRILKHKNYGKNAWNVFKNNVKINCNNNYEIINQLLLIDTFLRYFFNDKQMDNKMDKLLNYYARDLSFSLSRIYCASLMYLHWNYTKNINDKIAFDKYINGNYQGNYFNGGNSLVSKPIYLFVKNKFNISFDGLKTLAFGQSKL